jgi:hypothetical protein
LPQDFDMHGTMSVSVCRNGICWNGPFPDPDPNVSGVQFEPEGDEVDGVSPSARIRREGDGPPSLEVGWSIRDSQKVNIGDRLGASIRDDAGAEIVAGMGSVALVRMSEPSCDSGDTCRSGTVDLRER